MERPLLRTVVLIILALLVVECEQSDDSQEALGRPEVSSKQGQSLTIAVIPKGTVYDFWKTVQAGAEKAGRELGVEIVWKGPLREDDREAQISLVEDFITRRVSGIVLAPLDAVALRTPVEEAIAHGIPVLIFDSGLSSEAPVSYVATDNLRAGQLAGEHLGELLGGHGEVAMLRYEEGSESTGQRESGFLETLRDSPDIQVVSSNQYGGATAETCYKASENLLARFRTPEGGVSIDGIFCPNESTTFGMLRALQDLGLAGTVRFVGFDGTDKIIEGLRNRELDAVVVQNPMQMGYLGVKTLAEHLQGRDVPKRVDTGVALVTLENVDSPEIQAVLRPAMSE